MKILLYAVIVLVVFFPVLVPSQGTLIFGDDIHRSYHFFRQLFHEALTSGQFPWWNPYLFSGEPLIANPSLSFWYPFNWLFAILPYRLVYSWIIPIHIFIAMVGMFIFMKKLVGERAAWISGLVFGFSGFFMGRIWEGHVELILSAAWMPWVVWAFWKERVILAGVLLAIQIYAGYQTMALFTLEAVFIVTLLHCYIVKNIKPIFIFGVSVILGLGLAALQLIPSQEFFSKSIRTYDLPYSWAVFGSYTTNNLKQVVFPFILGDPANYKGPSPNYGEFSAYIGLIPLLLALLAIFFRKKYFVVFLLISAFGLWVSFGWNAPIDLNKFLWDAVPTYKYLRIPSRHLILFVFGMSALAGLGFSLARHSLLRLVLAGIIIVDLIVFARHFVGLRQDPETRHSKDLVAYLQKNLGLARVLPNFNVGMGTRDALDFDAAMAYKFFSASGYDPAILRNYYEFALAAGKIENPDVQRSDVQIPYLAPQSRYTDFLNVKYILVPSWFDSVAGSSKFSLIMEENKKDFWKLYENKNVLPRFFLAPSLVVLPTREEVAAAIRNEIYDPSKTVLTDNSSVKNQKFVADCQDKALSPVNMVSYSYNRIELAVDAPCNSFLATSEVMYPGWQASVDGIKAPIFEGNLAFRILYVPSGKHTVIMEYQPTIFYMAALVVAAAAGICLLWHFRFLRTR